MIPALLAALAGFGAYDAAKKGKSYRLEHEEEEKRKRAGFDKTLERYDMAAELGGFGGPRKEGELSGVSLTESALDNLAQRAPYDPKVKDVRERGRLGEALSASLSSAYDQNPQAAALQQLQIAQMGGLDGLMGQKDLAERGQRAEDIRAREAAAAGQFERSQLFEFNRAKEQADVEEERRRELRHKETMESQEKGRELKRELASKDTAESIFRYAVDNANKSIEMVNEDFKVKVLDAPETSEILLSEIRDTADQFNNSLYRGVGVSQLAELLGSAKESALAGLKGEQAFDMISEKGDPRPSDKDVEIMSKRMAGNNISGEEVSRRLNNIYNSKVLNEFIRSAAKQSYISNSVQEQKGVQELAVEYPNLSIDELRERAFTLPSKLNAVIDWEDNKRWGKKIFRDYLYNDMGADMDGIIRIDPDDFQGLIDQSEGNLEEVYKAMQTLFGGS